VLPRHDAIDHALLHTSEGWKAENLVQDSAGWGHVRIIGQGRLSSNLRPSCSCASRSPARAPILGSCIREDHRPRSALIKSSPIVLLRKQEPSPCAHSGFLHSQEHRTYQMWIGLPVTAIAASFIASEWVGWAWQV
jgi:hypothetical protein